MDPNPLFQLIELEDRIQYRTPAGPDESEFVYLPGRLPVLLSAPHGAAHQRQDRLKKEDEFTAALACWVAAQTGAQALYVHRQTSVDHSYHRDTLYKQFLAGLARQKKIHFVLDLHGASRRHPFGIALGTANGTSCTPGQRAVILAAFARHNFSPQGERCNLLDIDQAFPGGGGVRQETITAFSSRVLGVPAIQLEINAQMRIVTRPAHDAKSASSHSEPALILRLLDTLIDLTLSLADLSG